jgi:hypothetical protein
MIARMHDPIDGWGGGPGPLPPIEVKVLYATIAPTHIIAHMLCSSKNPDYTIKQNTTRPYRPKGVRKYTTQLEGWGGWRQRPPPTSSEFMPRYDTYNCFRAPVALQ